MSEGGALSPLDSTVRSQLSDEARAALRELHTVRPWRGLGLYLRAYALIAVAITAASAAGHIAVTALAVVFIGGQQHALYILNHDASHQILVRTRSGNKLVGTVLSNLLMFHHPEAWSYIQWRRVHLLHHLHLFTADDPNYVGRQLRKDTKWYYTPGALLWACAKGGVLSITQLFMSRQDYVPPGSREAIKGRDHHLRALLLPYRDDPEMEQERRIKLVVFAGALTAIGFFHLWQPFLLFWILPMYLTYPMILTSMDLTEHRWTAPQGDLNHNTRSTRVDLLTRCLLIPLPRTFHREHHVFPAVPVVGLPAVNQLLCKAGVTPPPLRGWPGLLREMAEMAASEGRSE